jgi:hypothetical protein
MKKFLFLLMVTLGVTTLASAKISNGSDGTAAVMTFSTDKHNFNVIPQGIPVTYDFTFTNTGKEPLLIKSATGSCGCTVPEYTQEAIAPGAKGKVKVTYNAAAMGTFTKTVTVNTNSATTPVIVLTINGEVKAAETKTTASVDVKTEKASQPAKN